MATCSTGFVSTDSTGGRGGETTDSCSTSTGVAVDSFVSVLRRFGGVVVTGGVKGATRVGLLEAF